MNAEVTGYAGPDPQPTMTPPEARRLPATSRPPRVRNAFTVDVEDWFHILGEGCALPVDRWASMESRVERPTRRLLDIFDGAGIKGTFFVLGWVSERYPSLVREIAARGHEVASHGYHHALVYDLTPAAFRADVSAAKRRTEDVTGEPVLGYRAPGFSVRRDTLWALDVLLEEGFAYDSSIMPAPHGHGGLIGLDDRPQRVSTPNGARIPEFPLSTYTLGGKPLPFSGGGYLRLFPVKFIEHAIRVANAGTPDTQRPVTMYLHPREVDPGQPRLPGLPLRRRFKYYVGLKTAEAKVLRLVSRFPFAPLRELHAAYFGAGAPA